MNYDNLNTFRRGLTADLLADDITSANTMRLLDAVLTILSDNEAVAISSAVNPMREIRADSVLEPLPVLDDATIAIAMDSLGESMGDLLAEEGVTLVRRESGMRAFLDADDRNVIRNVDATLVFDGIRDNFGREIDIGLLRPIQKIALLPAAGETPVMLLTAAQRPNSGDRTVQINAGTVWIAARILAPDDGPEGFVGVRVDEGTLELEKAVRLIGDDVILNGGLQGKITLRLSASSVGERRVDAAPPQEIVITFSRRGLPVAQLTSGNARADAVALTFRSSTIPLRYDVGRGRIVFGCDVEPDIIDTAELALKEMTFSGNTALEKAGWAVPITEILNPDTLPEAAGSYAWTVQFTDPVTVRWLGGPQLPVRLEGATLSIGPDGYLIETETAVSANVSDAHIFSLWRLPNTTHRVTVSIALGASFQAAFGCAEDGSELTRFTGTLAAILGRPVDASGNPIPLGVEPIEVRITGQPEQRRLELTPAHPEIVLPFVRRTLALENAYLLVGTLRLALIAGRLIDGTQVVDGRAGMIVPVVGWIPTLPDPYVDNLAVGRDSLLNRQTLATLGGLFNWKAGTAEFNFEGQLGNPSTGKVERTGGDPRSAPKNDASHSYRSQEDQGALIPQKGQFDFPPIKPVPQKPQRGEPAKQTIEAVREFEAQVTELGIAREGCMLLDVSTARHQIGVQIADQPRSSISGGLFVQGVRVGAPLAGLRVFALPQIQWEPVRTLAKDQDPVTLGIFPSPLASADDGGPTVIASNAAVLAPVIPELTLDTQMEQLNEGEQLNIVSTLPFGMKTLVQLRPPGPNSDSARYVQPDFPTPRPLQGALQVTLRAQENLRLSANSESRSFKGRAVQIPNGIDIDTGNGLDISVLGSTIGNTGSVETLFNQEFSGDNTRVPLTRFDISGYGASTFSDWINPNGSFAETTRAQFKVMIGRTALEVVKVASVLYPWGIRVTRSVTIERRGGGGVIRRDSGWQAQTPGLFDFTSGAVVTQPFEIHPGLIRGVYDADRIRPIGPDLFARKRAGSADGLRRNG